MPIKVNRPGRDAHDINIFPMGTTVLRILQPRLRSWTRCAQHYMEDAKTFLFCTADDAGHLSDSEGEGCAYPGCNGRTKEERDTTRSWYYLAPCMTPDGTISLFRIGWQVRDKFEKWQKDNPADTITDYAWHVDKSPRGQYADWNITPAPLVGRMADSAPTEDLWPDEQDVVEHVQERALERIKQWQASLAEDAPKAKKGVQVRKKAKPEPEPEPEEPTLTPDDVADMESSEIREWLTEHKVPFAKTTSRPTLIKLMKAALAPKDDTEPPY